MVSNLLKHTFSVADRKMQYECFVRLEKLSVESKLKLTFFSNKQFFITFFYPLITGFFLLKYNIKECSVSLQRLTVGKGAFIAVTPVTYLVQICITYSPNFSFQSNVCNIVRKKKYQKYVPLKLRPQCLFALWWKIYLNGHRLKFPNLLHCESQDKSCIISINQMYKHQCFSSLT